MNGGGFGFVVEARLEKAMDLDKPDFSSKDPDKGGGGSSSSCSICLEVVLDQVGRSIAKLQCGHEFHLDCIGSAFNAKGVMQCPNCRKVEKGRWLYANGHRSSPDFDIDGWVTEDFYELNYPDLPFGFQWCPLRGFTQLASFFQEGESQQNYYNEVMGNTLFGDHSSSSTSTSACPYLALHGFPRAMHSAPSSSADSVPDNSLFHRRSNSLGGQSSADMINSHSSAAELRNQEWLQQPSFLFPLSLSSDQFASHLGMRISRNGSSTQQRLGSIVHPHPLVVPGVVTPLTATGEVRGQHHARGGHGGHIYQQPVPSSTLRNSPFAAPMRSRARARARAGGVTLNISSAATSTNADIGGFYGFSLLGSVNRNRQDTENISRHFERIYRNGWGREGFTPLPWNRIPLEGGESQWWSPFNPNPRPQSGSFPQRTQNQSENGYQRMPPPRMPPFM